MILIVILLVYMIEFFIPLSARYNMNYICRKALLEVEVQGGLNVEIREYLQERLAAAGFTNISIEGTDSARYGGEVNLHVEADYVYNKLTGLFQRSDIVQHMSYIRTSIARRVVN